MSGSGSSKGTTAIEVGSYVKWGETVGNATVHKRGQVTELASGGRVKIQPVDKDSSVITVDLTEVELSRMTGMRMNMTSNLLEVAENVVGNSLILRMFGHHFTGPSSISFAISDAVWEFGLKGFVSPLAGFLGAPAISPTDENADSTFKMSDVMDVGRRVPFTWILTQTVQKFVFKKAFWHNAVVNLGAQAGSMYATNVVDRYFRYDKDKGGYKYP